MQSGTISEQLQGLNFTNEDFALLRKALENQLSKDEGNSLSGYSGLSSWNYGLSVPSYLSDMFEKAQRVKAGKAYQTSIELQHKLILLKDILNQPVAAPADTRDSEPCNCLVCQIERVVKRTGGAGLEILVQKVRNENWQDVPMNREDPKGSHTES